MIFSDIAHLKWSLLTLLLSMIACGIATGLSNAHLDRTLQELLNAQRQVSAAQGKLRSTQNDLASLSTYAPEYAALADHKIIADEQRLDWIEELEKLHRQHRVVNLKYTLAAQQPYPALNSENFEIKLSPLNLQLELLHEMQLLQFIAALRSDTKGLFILDQCTLERIGTTSTSTGAQLKADCSGGWITIKHRGAP